MWLLSGSYWDPSQFLFLHIDLLRAGSSEYPNSHEATQFPVGMAQTLVTMTSVILGISFFLFSPPLSKCDSFWYLHSLVVNYIYVTCASLRQDSNRWAFLIFFSPASFHIFPLTSFKEKLGCLSCIFFCPHMCQRAIQSLPLQCWVLLVQGTHYSPAFLARDYFKHLHIILGRACWEGFSLLGTTPSPFRCSYVLIFVLCLLKAYLAVLNLSTNLVNSKRRVVRWLEQLSGGRFSSYWTQLIILSFWNLI